MTKKELRAEALRAAGAIEIRQVETDHMNTFDFAELYFDFLCFGRVPIQVGRPVRVDSPSSKTRLPDEDQTVLHPPKQ